jgi:hypothetical protein
MVERSFAADKAQQIPTNARAGEQATAHRQQSLDRDTKRTKERGSKAEIIAAATARANKTKLCTLRFREVTLL